MGVYPNALSFYEKSVNIQQKTLTENHVDFGWARNNMGA
ncbi:unnamed protein product, partial [Rotaria magnacalcarata]